MTVAELIELLEVQPQDSEVRLAIQPRNGWPFEHRIAGVAGPDEIKDQLLADLEEDDEDGPDEDELESEAMERIGNVVYIGEGGQLGYLPSVAKVAFDGSY